MNKFSEFLTSLKIVGAAYSESDYPINLQLKIDQQVVFSGPIKTFTNSKFDLNHNSSTVIELTLDQTFLDSLKNSFTVSLSISHGCFLFRDFFWGFKKARRGYKKIINSIKHESVVMIGDDLRYQLLILGKNLFDSCSYEKIQKSQCLTRSEYDYCLEILSKLVSDIHQWRTVQGHLSVNQQRYLLKNLNNILPEHMKLLFITGHGQGCDTIDSVLDLITSYQPSEPNFVPCLLIDDSQVCARLAEVANFDLMQSIKIGMIIGEDNIKKFNDFLSKINFSVQYQSALKKSYNWRYGMSEFNRIFQHDVQPWVIISGTTVSFDYNYDHLSVTNDK